MVLLFHILNEIPPLEKPPDFDKVHDDDNDDDDDDDNVQVPRKQQKSACQHLCLSFTPTWTVLY